MYMYVYLYIYSNWGKREKNRDAKRELSLLSYVPLYLFQIKLVRMRQVL